MKPPILYFGGKALVGPRIAALLPLHVHYVGAVLRVAGGPTG